MSFIMNGEMEVYGRARGSGGDGEDSPRSRSMKQERVRQELH